MLVSHLAYSSTVKMDVICSSEMLANAQWTIQRYIPEDMTLDVLFTLFKILQQI
jgi:hypothetical protein